MQFKFGLDLYSAWILNNCILFITNISPQISVFYVVCSQLNAYILDIRKYSKFNMPLNTVSIKTKTITSLEVLRQSWPLFYTIQNLVGWGRRKGVTIRDIRQITERIGTTSD